MDSPFRCCLAGLVIGALAAQAFAQEKDSPPLAPRVLWHIDKPNFYDELAARDGLFWAGGQHLSAHAVSTGAEVHRAAVEGPWHQPVLGGGLVFARHYDGTLHAFATDLSRALWRKKLLNTRFVGTAHGDMFVVTSGTKVVAVTGGEEHWSVDLGSGIAMRPATDGRRVYVGTTGGTVVGIDLQTGVEAWRTASGAEFGSSSPAVDDGVLFLADRGIRGQRKAALNAFDAETGRLLWSTQFGATGFSRPHPHGDRIWAGFGGCVAAFDRGSGRLDREHSIPTGRNPFGLPGVAGDAIVFGNLDGNLYVHDLRTRELRWRLEAGAGERVQVGGWCLHDGVLLVGTTRGMFAIGETEDAEPAAPGFVLRPPGR